MVLVVITPPAVEPLSTAEAKLHLRVDVTADDTLIVALVKAAREQAEAFLARALIDQTLELVLDEFPAGAGAITLPMPPLSSVVSITYKDTAGVSTVLDASKYDAPASPGLWPARVPPAFGLTWPATKAVPEAVAVRYVAGYGAAGANMPETIRQGMLLLVGHLYEHRESVVMGAAPTVLPQSTHYLWWPHRAKGF